MPIQDVGYLKIARELFDRAIELSAPQLGVRNVQEAVEELRRGRCYECDKVRANLARLVADYIATVDSQLRAVYFYNPEYAVGDYQSPYDEPFKSSALYLLVWTRALDSIPADNVNGLTDAFDSARTPFLCPDASSLCFSLDLTVVSDAQVKGRKGYAVMIDSPTARPIQVWPREGAVNSDR